MHPRIGSGWRHLPYRALDKPNNTHTCIACCELPGLSEAPDTEVCVASTMHVFHVLSSHIMVSTWLYCRAAVLAIGRGCPVVGERQG